MVRMFVRHPVEDYSRWRKAYDDFDSERTSMGVNGDAVYQATGDPNDVTVWHDFDSVEAAKDFMNSDRLKEVMQAAGVAGAPTIWFTTPAH